MNQKNVIPTAVFILAIIALLITNMHFYMTQTIPEKRVLIISVVNFLTFCIGILLGYLFSMAWFEYLTQKKVSRSLILSPVIMLIIMSAVLTLLYSKFAAVLLYAQIMLILGVVISVTGLRLLLEYKKVQKHFYKYTKSNKS
jgi:hypothetical protein